MLGTKRPRGKRRDSREWALQLLFQLDVNPSRELDPVFAAFWREQAADAVARGYTETLVRGVREHLEEIDRRIVRFADNWAIRRMGVVDRNVIRMGLYELYYNNKVPPVVAINEAVDVAKYFSNTESGRFVNGILDRARKDIEANAVAAPDAPIEATAPTAKRAKRDDRSRRS